MAAPVGPGDFVECILTAGRTYPRTGFAVGALYCVEDVAPQARCEAGHLCIGLRLVGMPTPPDGGFWSGCAFRPIYRRREGAFDYLKAPPARARQAEEA